MKPFMFWLPSILRSGLFVLITVAAALSAAAQGMDQAKWTALGTFGHIVFYCGVISVAGGTILATLDKTHSDLSKRKTDEDTQVFRRDQFSTKTNPTVP